MLEYHRYISLVVFLLLAGGCSDPTPAPDLVTTRAAQSVGKPEEELNVPGPGVLDEVQWDEVQGYREISEQRLSEQAQKVVKEVPVPVLLPDDDELLGSVYLTSGDTWYTASMRAVGITVVVNGSGKSRELPGVTTHKEGEREEQGDHFLTRTHGIVTLSFREFGVAYSIDVECASPMEDRRCTEDDFVIDLAENAGVVGGER